MKISKCIFPAAMLVVSAVFAGCASNDQQWVSDGTPKSEAEQALAECQYQAEAATVTIGANDRPATWEDAISHGVADGVVQAMDEAELVKSCMHAKGFTR